MFFRKRPSCPLVTLGTLGFLDHFLYDDHLYANMGASVDGGEYPVMRMDCLELSKLPKSTLVLRVSVHTIIGDYEPPSHHY